MSGHDLGRYVAITALLVAGALGALAALRGRRAARQGHGAAGDAPVWAALAAAYGILAFTKLARIAGLLHGPGQWLRVIARQLGFYGNRRPFQIAASLLVAAVALGIFLYGVVTYWQEIKRYRLAVGFAALAVGFAGVRFISLHEVDAWIVAMPWIGQGIEVVAAIGAGAVAVARVGQLRALEGAAVAPERAP